MIVTSHWSKGQAFWRTFTKNDTVYLVGLRQGTVGDGGTLVYNNPTGYFQLELKRGDLFGSSILSPGAVYANSDEYILFDSGAFETVEDATVVTINPGGFQFEPYGGSVVQFFQQGSADSSITITSTVVQTETTSGTSQTTVTSEATDENGVQVGAKETVSGGEGLKGGVELSQSASSKVTSKISNVIATTYGFSVTTQETYTESQPVVLKADKLVAVKSSWQRRFVTGAADLDTVHLTWNATLGYLGSRAIQEFDSPAQLPPDLLAAYLAQNPDYLPPSYLADGSLLQETGSAPVYVIFGGAKFWVPSIDVLNQLYGGWGGVHQVAQGALTPVPSVPRDGTILREQDHSEVWMIAAGTKRHIVSPAVLDNYGGWAVVRVVPDDSTDPFAEGSPVTS